eukprot:scaffold895_cov286-Prasinococcus_capsulatus_cf.AAC.4
MDDYDAQEHVLGTPESRYIPYAADDDDDGGGDGDDYDADAFAAADDDDDEYERSAFQPPLDSGSTRQLSRIDTGSSLHDMGMERTYDGGSVFDEQGTPRQPQTPPPPPSRNNFSSMEYDSPSSTQTSATRMSSMRASRAAPAPPPRPGTLPANSDGAHASCARVP